ncbi:MAG: hypothetical protein J0I93_06175 [Legionella sp.]|nr:hypothetical protein [Legionella sp.]
MSSYFKLLCDAIRENDAVKLNNIGKIINENIFTNVGADLCINYHLNREWFLNLLGDSKFDVTFKDGLLSWLFTIESLQEQHNTFRNDYLSELDILVSDFHEKSSTANNLEENLIELNNSLATNSIFIYLAFIEGKIKTSTLPSETRQKFLFNLIMLAYNFINTNKCANEYNTSRFFNALVCLHLKGFTIENLVEILSIHPAWSLAYAVEFYDNFRNELSHEELQALIVQVRFVDWEHISKASLSNQQKQFIIHHIRNHPIESLSGRAFDSMTSKTKEGFESASKDPLKYLVKEEPAPKTVEAILHQDWRMSPLPGGFFSSRIGQNAQNESKTNNSTFMNIYKK